jgi:CRP-like cAMP-binding protein
VRKFCSNGVKVDLSRYIPHLDKQTFAAGETIFELGDAGSTMFIIVEGDVEVAYDHERSVRLGPGESFGEMSLIDKRPRSATVTAVTDVTLSPIGQGTFLVLVQETPYFALEGMQSLSDRLRRANRMPRDGT